MNNKIRKIFSGWLGIVILFVSSGLVYGAYLTVNTSSTFYSSTATNKEINEWGTCKNVKDIGSSYFIPTKYAVEWTAVQNNSVADLIFSDPASTVYSQGVFYNCGNSTSDDWNVSCYNKCSTPGALKCYKVVPDTTIWGHAQCSGLKACKCYRPCTNTVACGTTTESNCGVSTCGSSSIWGTS